MRGTLAVACVDRPRHRFIPARAGNTASTICAERRPVRFIPARAGNTVAARSASRSAGSSPRVRGTCVTQRADASAVTVHPRACGEHISMPITRDGYNGSSPRVRGTLRPADADLDIDRFIPARAGNTPACADDEARDPVHPRACGEHMCSRRRASAGIAVHPRACGEHCRGRRCLCRRCRFIPARAGNTPVEAIARRVTTGSSPRVRGTRD